MNSNIEKWLAPVVIWTLAIALVPFKFVKILANKLYIIADGQVEHTKELIDKKKIELDEYERKLW